MATNTLYRNIALLLLYCATALGYAQALTLDSLWVVIQHHNPQLKAYQRQTEAYKAMAQGTRALEAPQIGAGFFMTPYSSRYWRDQEMKFKGMPAMAPGMGNIMIQARQMIPNPYKLKASYKYQLSLVALEDEKGKGLANELRYEAKLAYHEVQILDRKTRVLHQAKGTLAAIIQQAEQKIAHSQENLANLYKAKAQAALLDKDLWMLQGERQQWLARLNTLMNRHKGLNIEVDTAFILKDYESQVLDSATALSERSDLVAMDKNITSMRLKQNVELAKGKPEFGLEYGHMISFGSTPNQFTLMGMMSLPFAPWSSKMYKANSKAAHFEVEAMSLQREAMATETLSILQGIQQEIDAAKYQRKLYLDVLLPTLQKTYDLAMIAYANSAGELFMALEARMNLQMAHMQYWDIHLDILKLQADYERQVQVY